jgi:MFS family permease
MTRLREPVTPGQVPARSWATLMLLGLLYFVSFIDRIVLALLVGPLKQDLGIGDASIGILFGTAFALFYGVLGLPFARLADSENRTRLILIGALLWSFSTIVSGFVGSFGLLICLRFGLAIGEAALTPSAFSMIGDMFPARLRARAASIYSACGMAGAGGSYILGGLLVGWLDIHAKALPHGLHVWQLTFILVGIPALLLTLFFAIVAREPARSHQGVRLATSSRAAIIRLLGHERLGLVLLGAGLCQVPAYAMTAWMPYQLIHQFGYPVPRAGLEFGLIAIAATVGGTLILTWFSDRLRDRGQPGAVMWVSGLAAATGLIALLGAGFCRNAPPMLALSGVGLFALTGATNNVLAGLQHLVPADLRATFAALCVMAVALIGLGLGPPLLAFVTGLGLANGWAGAPLALLTIASSVPAIACLLMSARRRTV